MLLKIGLLFLLLAIIQVVVGPPVDTKKKDKENKDEPDPDDYGLEYGRYLQQVVQALEEDKEFAKKLENISAEQIRSGQVAMELEFVKHNVRSKLDELKRIEVDRLRKMVLAQMEREELGLYRHEDGRVMSGTGNNRKWRTTADRSRGSEGGVGDGEFWLGLDRKGVKIPQHIDINNPHSFEISDLKKLIQTATTDLEALDKQRRDEFKKYELEKEAKYRESLKNMTEDERKETEKHHQELIEKHKDHPKMHHPGSKPQLEEVWSDQDHMPKEEFNPKTFFAMHDINGDGHLDVEEIEAILIPEVKKMYNPNNEEDDPAEMVEEFHRMREHIFNETDKNKDSLISLEEFLKMTEQQDFQQDEGWRGLDEQPVYSEAEVEEYMRQRQLDMQRNPQYYGGDPRMYYDHPNAQQQGMPPNIHYQPPNPNVVPPNAGYQQGHPQQFQQPPQYQAYPQGSQFQGHPPQPPYQGHPNQFQGHPQQFQGQPQYQVQPPQQQHIQGQPPHQQQFQGQPPHQQFQGQPPHQQFQGQPPQQQFQGQPPQQQQFQGQPIQQQQAQGAPIQAQGNNIPAQGSPQQNNQPKEPVQKIDDNKIPYDVKPNVPEKKEAVASVNHEENKKQS